MWSKQPVPSVYKDMFDASGFVSGINLCSAASVPQRTYTLSLSKKSLVFASLISSHLSAASFAGIGYNGVLCGFNSNPIANGTASASCAFVLLAGTHIINFCVNQSTFNPRGSIIVLPND